MDTDTKISNGIANCAIILTANKMGYSPSYVDLAKKSIGNGGHIEPVMIGSFSGEAIRVHNLIAKDMRHEEANRIAVRILAEYGY